MTSVGAPALNGLLIHYAIAYTNGDDYLGGVLPFLRDGLSAGEPALVFAPDSNLRLLRARLDRPVGPVTFLDAADVARNPARIIPAARHFADAHPGRRIRVVGEPIWPGRSNAEIREGIRHEACVNALFADVAATVLCPYDRVGLDAAVLGATDRTHPHVAEGGEYRSNARFVDPAGMLASSDPLPAAPGHAESFVFHHGDLAALRGLVRDHAGRVGLGWKRCQDLLLAVSEAAANTLIHTREPGTVRIWRHAEALVCEISDHGHITDPLVGRLAPTADVGRGRGLWMVNQLCDLVELHSGVAGTTVRMHISIG